MDGTCIKRKVKKPNIKIDRKIIEEAMTESQVERQVIVHCIYRDLSNDWQIQICKTTFLRDRDSSHKSKLIKAYNITVEPSWQDYRAGTRAMFTLVFSGLPKSCTSFDLFEETDGGEFYTGVISRNESDTYTVDILC